MTKPGVRSSSLDVDRLSPPPSDLLERCLKTPGVVVLDSSDRGSAHSQWTVIGLFPAAVLQDYASVKAFVQTHMTDGQGHPDLPFTGGLMGYMSYEAASQYADYQDGGFFHHPESSQALPPLGFAVIQQAILIDHRNDTYYYIQRHLPGYPRPMAWSDLWEKIQSTALQKRSENRPYSTHPQSPESHVTAQDYMRLVEKAQDHIRDGDIYQVNLSHRFSLALAEDPTVIYSRLRYTSPAPYSAYINVGENTIMSTSPECFLRMKGRQVTTCPIKGTRARGHDLTADRRQKEALLTSEKDQAELLMITDLCRHDLGRVCDYGSVQVAQLKKIESYAQVHHLVSTITGHCQEGVSVLDVMAALFPGGSITGAPKRRSMQIIYDLETYARQVYTGVIGYMDVDGTSQFNIAIRTLYTNGPMIYFHVGGGIVADSDPRLEWEETLVKAKGMMSGIGMDGRPVSQNLV